MSNIIDNFIGYINPRAGLGRELARQALQQARSYDGAAHGRRTSGWGRSAGDVNAVLNPKLEVLRRTSRDMVRNNPYVFKAIGGIVYNTVGTGIRLNVNGDNEKAVKAYKKGWKAWSESTECDFYGQLNLYGLQELAMRTIVESGEVLIIKRRVNSKSYKTVPIKLQVVEPDFFDTTKDTGPSTVGNYIEGGIEYNQKGQRLGYWLYDKHPGASNGYTQKSAYYSVDNVQQVFRILRPGQQHGVPAGVASYLRAHDLDDYEDAQLQKQITAACYAAFIQDTSPDSLATGTENKKKLTTRLEPGLIQTLPSGKTITFSSPPSPEGYDTYTRRILQAIAAGFEITYEVLTGDLSNVNFSTGRMGWLEFHRLITSLQNNMFIPQACDPIVSWFSVEMEILGVSTTDMSFDWTAPRREMIDVVSETEAIVTQIRAGLIDYGEAVRELGFNPEDLLANIKKWFDMFKSMGLNLECDPATLLAGMGKAQKPTTAEKDIKPSDKNPPDTSPEKKKAAKKAVKK